ncbi:MAG: hypothetical protein IJE00_01925 [Clostridia bacterium]|nr:hypothetical protein [Clostridia bacterium]
MRKVISLWVTISLLLGCVGCYSAPRLEDGTAMTVAKQYNHTPLQELSFEKAVPIDDGLSYFFFANPYRDDPEYDQYLITNPADVVPNYSERVSYYAIPKEVVEDYILDLFVAIDHSEGTDRTVLDGERYLFSGLGGGTNLAGAYLRVYDKEQTGRNATFLCDMRLFSTDEVWRTQRFTVRYTDEKWKIVSVETLFSKE